MKKRRIGMCVTAAAAFCGLGCFTPALAVDGVVEINHAKALAGDVTSVDSPGYPVVIASPGSYRLTGMLHVSSPTTNAIRIETSNVTVDLNGFTIGGPGAGTGNGVAVTAGGNVRVRNGTIRGFGGDGISADVDVHVDRVQVMENVGSGIRVEGDGAIVTRCMARHNGADGIRTGPASVVSECTAVLNGGDGIRPGPGSTVVGNAAARNTASGISSLHGCTVLGNSVRGNVSYGLNLTTDTGYRGNVSTDNTLGNVLSGQQIGGNVCHTALCP